MVEISPLIGRGQRISAAAYTGRAVAPGAVVESDPEAKALITKNSLQLGIVSNQMQNLTAQMQSLTGSLQVIGTNLQQQNICRIRRKSTKFYFKKHETKHWRTITPLQKRRSKNTRICRRLCFFNLWSY